MNDSSSVPAFNVHSGVPGGSRLIEASSTAGLRAVFSENQGLDLLELNFNGCKIVRMATGGLPSGPAEACLSETDGKLVIKGQFCETTLQGGKLSLSRTIEIPLNGAAITWQDIVENTNAEAVPFHLRYQLNFGPPFLAPVLQLTFPPELVLPQTAAALAGLPEYDQIGAPADGAYEQIFQHKLIAGDSPEAAIQLVNPGLNIAAKLIYTAAELPVLMQRKSLKPDDYTLGIELGTDDKQIIPGFGRRQFNIRLELA